MKNVILCYILGVIALFGMILCIAEGERGCAFILSIVELSSLIVGNFIQSERVLKHLHFLNREMYKISSDIISTKNSIDFIGRLSNRNMIDVASSIDELKQKVDKTEEIKNVNLKSN